MSKILLDNKILEAAEEKLEAGITPQYQDAYMRIVVAGMRVALDKGPNGILAGLKQSTDPIRDCAIGAFNLVAMMRHQSRGTMPVQPMIAAATTLMFKALDSADRMGLVKVGADELVQATHILFDHVMAAFKITMPMLQKLAQKAHAIAQDPAQMETLARRAGVVKHPEASEPTPLPEAAPAAPEPKPAGKGMINRGADNAEA